MWALPFPSLSPSFLICEMKELEFKGNSIQRRANTFYLVGTQFAFCLGLVIFLAFGSQTPIIKYCMYYLPALRCFHV